MKTTLFILFSFLFISLSCSENTVSYQVAENYFVKNTIKDRPIHAVKINTANELTTYFGLATTMGKAGKPTAIDFERQYALALIAPSTNLQTTLEISNLNRDKDALVLHYHISHGKEQSFTMRPFVLLILNKADQGNFRLQEDIDPT